MERISNQECPFCDGYGDFLTSFGDREVAIPCQACLGTGMDDCELYLIMSNMQPEDGCGTTVVRMEGI